MLSPRGAETHAPGQGVKLERMGGGVVHTFKHFPLELIVYVGCVKEDALAPKGMRWVKLEDVSGEALPNVMRKVLAHAKVDMDIKGGG